MPTACIAPRHSQRHFIDELAEQLLLKTEHLLPDSPAPFANLSIDAIAERLLDMRKTEWCLPESHPTTSPFFFKSASRAYDPFRQKVQRPRSVTPEHSLACLTADPEPTRLCKPPIKRKAAQEAELQIHEQTKPRQYTSRKHLYCHDDDQEAEGSSHTPKGGFLPTSPEVRPRQSARLDFSPLDGDADISPVSSPDGKGPTLEDEKRLDRSPFWTQCEACGQWTTVEDCIAWPPPGGKWRCRMNTWNPGMAYCLTQGQFYEQYRNFVLQRNEGHLLRRVACIHGRPVDLWHLYNLVTQLGGWRTIYSNRWQPLLYCDKPEWAHHTDIGNRLKVIYTKYLLAFEGAYFRGKRYATLEEANRLFVPLSRRAQPSFGASCLKGDRRERLQVNSRVWVKVGTEDWWPGKIVEENSISPDGLRLKLGRHYLVALYQQDSCVWTTRQALEPFIPTAHPLASQAAQLAVEAALADPDARPVTETTAAGDDLYWSEGATSPGASSETTEGVDPKFDIRPWQPPKPRGRPPKSDTPRPTGRPRGRPPKNGRPPAAVVQPPQPPVAPKPRGRPPKHGYKAAPPVPPQGSRRITVRPTVMPAEATMGGPLPPHTSPQVPRDWAAFEERVQPDAAL
eukprot:GGOE01017888.1.p1 GENE.GGOE01017888.1~~GGOE01017888.1.p1  ORF type:complete len:644 (+),score=100.00 GGOE01017888.1:63-1934(+)